MRIASVSDIHLDYRANRELFRKMTSAIGARQPDVVIVAGDVSHIDDLIAACIEVLKRVSPHVAYLPGNHDLWIDRPGEDLRDDPSTNTWERHDQALEALAESVGGHYLPAGPLRIGNVAIAGSCGWYDYSFFRPELREQVPESALLDQALDGIQWSDRTRIAFRHPDGSLMSNPEVARRMERVLDEQLAQLERDPKVREVVCATHHLQYEQAVRRAGTLPWEFFNAFMGSRSLGAVIDGHSKVRHVIYGHTHTPGDYQIGPRRVFGTPLGYARERKGMSEQEVLETRIGWIEIERGDAAMHQARAVVGSDQGP